MNLAAKWDIGKVIEFGVWDVQKFQLSLNNTEKHMDCYGFRSDADCIEIAVH